MVISTISALELAAEGGYSKFIGSKASLTNANPGQFFSLWTAAGLPGTGVAPGTTPVVPTNTTTGAFNFTQQTAPATSYLDELIFSTSTSATSIELHDRLVHSSGLSGASISAQTITGFDLSTLSGTSNLTERIGDSNYSDVQWWLEIYSDVGGTSVNASINFTYNDGTTGTSSNFLFGSTVRRAGTMFSLNSLIPAADQGKFIRGINSITLSATTGTVGNFGFTATRYRAGVFAETFWEPYRAGWTNTQLPQIFNSSCLALIVICGSSNTGVSQVSGKIIHG